MKDTELTAENPDLSGIDVAALENTGAYYDGSGGGVRQFAWELKNLREEEERINVLRCFIRKHQQILTRLCWSTDSGRWRGKDSDECKTLLPEIEINGRTFDKRPVDAKEIARQWPKAAWCRAIPYLGISENEERHYLALVDGVMIRITKAEVLPRVKEVSRFGPCGRVKI